MHSADIRKAAPRELPARDETAHDVQRGTAGPGTRHRCGSLQGAAGHSLAGGGRSTSSFARTCHKCAATKAGRRGTNVTVDEISNDDLSLEALEAIVLATPEKFGDDPPGAVRIIPAATHGNGGGG